VAEVDGNRTRQTEVLGVVGFEDRGDHQAAYTSTTGEPVRQLPDHIKGRAPPAGIEPATNRLEGGCSIR
jgi:hypothetical protein